jgi:hypothetical protein
MRSRRTRTLVAAFAASAVVVAPTAAMADPLPAPEADGAFVYVGHGDSRWAEQAVSCDTGEQQDPLQGSAGVSTGLSPGSHSMTYEPAFPQLESYATALYDGVPLSDLTRLVYSSYTSPSGPDPVPPLGFRLSVDEDGDGAADAHLYFDPEFNADQHPPLRVRWQEWDVLGGRLTTSGGAPSDEAVTFADYVAAHPDARLAPWAGEAGAVALIAGCWRGPAEATDVEYYVDGVVIGLDGLTTAYRFANERSSFPEQDFVRADDYTLHQYMRVAYDDQTGEPLEPQSSYDWVVSPSPIPSSEVPPKGVGVLSIPLPADSAGRVEQWWTTTFDTTGLGLIKHLTYQTWSSSDDGSAKPPPYLRLDVDVDLDDAADDSIYFFPGENPGQGAPANERWQTWDAGIGLWSTSPDSGAGSLFTLRQYALEHPHATIAQATPEFGEPGGFNILVGGSQTGQSAATYRIDDVVLAGFPDGGVDFEPPITDPEITVHPGHAVEGNDGSTTLPVRIRLSAWEPVPVTVDVETLGGTAKPYVDFVPLEEHWLTIDTANSFATFDVQVVGDRDWERNEYFRIRIKAVNTGYVTEPVGKAWIRNDDTLVKLNAVPRADRRLDVSVSTHAPQPGAVVAILRGTTVLLSGALDDMGNLQQRIDKRFRPGTIVRLRAQVETPDGPYTSDPIVVRVGS